MSRNERKRVPKLRFREFENTWWEKAPLGREDVSTFVNEKISLEELKLETYVSTENLLPDYGDIVRASKLPLGGSFTRFKRGDVLISNIRPYLKKVWTSNMEGAASNDVVVVRSGAAIRGDFLSYLLRNDSFIKYVMQGAQGVKMPRGDKSSMLEFPVTFPTKAEQKKIADCLSSLDELITAENQKLEGLQLHKKGLIQQLFPAGGEKMPGLRFKEFKDSGEWEEKTLEEVATFLKGKGISKSDIAMDGAQPCIRYGELYTCYKEVINSVISFTSLSPEELILSEANDVIIPSSGETREDIATASCVIKPGIALGGDLNVLRSEINGIFLAYYLTHAKKNEIAKLAQGDAVVHLYASQLRKLKINFPKLKDEQQKIAESFSSIDGLVIALCKKLESLKAHKKGLMQRLFPSITEIEA